MPVAKPILLKIHSLFHEYNVADNNEEFAKIHRKEIKIIVDSLFEQIIESLLGEKPRNAMTARVMINNHDLSNSTDADKKLLGALKNLLSQYHCLDSKAYIDHTNSIVDFVSNELYELSLSLVIHTSLSKNSHAKALKKLLRSIS
jgi:hypothetical protein